jgi:hypothetical protein
MMLERRKRIALFVTHLSGPSALNEIAEEYGSAVNEPALFTKMFVRSMTIFAVPLARIAPLVRIRTLSDVIAPEVTTCAVATSCTPFTTLAVIPLMVIYSISEATLLLTASVLRFWALETVIGIYVSRFA